MLLFYLIVSKLQLSNLFMVEKLLSINLVDETKFCQMPLALLVVSQSEKTRKSNHLQMSLQRQHFLLNYLKILSVGSAGV